MSAAIVLGEVDRGPRGKLTATLHNASPAYVAFRHTELDGREGGRLVVKIDEAEIVTKLLQKAQAVAGASKQPQHRTVRVRAELERQIEEDDRLF